MRMPNRWTSSVAAFVASVGLGLPQQASADPTPWQCGRTRNVGCFNCSALDNEDNSNSCAPSSNRGRTKDDFTMLFTPNTNMWVDVGVAAGSDLKLALYATSSSVCNASFANTNQYPGWGFDPQLGFEVSANATTYIAVEELDDDWDFSPSWRMNMYRFGCCPDNDGDETYAYNAAACPNMPVSKRDCNDSDGTNAPGRPEVCDGRDNNCDGQADNGLTFRRYYRDADGDNFGNSASFRDACAQPSGYVLNNTDCNDSERLSYPGRTEVCDGIDNNCNLQTDEGTLSTFYRDFDGDNYGDSNNAQQACSQPNGFNSRSGDCNDNDAARYPGNPEVCDNKDNDCNNVVDDGAGTVWYRDADSDGSGLANVSRVSCSQPSGFVSSAGDCDDTTGLRRPGLNESCDGLDNDCNFIIDDGVGQTWYVDADGDDRGNPNTGVQSCSNPGGRVLTFDDCDDTTALRSPLRDEVCDGIDNDCDLVVDDGVGPVWFRDADRDQFGDSTSQRQSCSQPAGYVNNSSDCDDGTNRRYPGLAETCDGLDNNCNVAIDEDAVDALTWYNDFDGDGYGDPGQQARQCDNPGGYVSNGGDCNDRASGVNPGAVDTPYDTIDQDCVGGDVCDADGDGVPATIGLCGGSDCADGDPNIRPGVTEVVDGIDNDCDGVIDEDSNANDDDRDGWTEDAGDCDDADPSVFPGAREVCSGTDSDCDGVVDEDTLCTDDDNDGSSEDQGDCNDSDPNVGPHAQEFPGNGIDDDCDGVVDAGGFDTDGDGVTEDAGDCDDLDPSVYPSAVEVADGVDNNCDGEIDENTDASDDDLDGFTEEEGDCDDDNEDINPDAVEIRNGRDDDCNGITDDQGADWDDDGDGLTDAEGDCDDGDASIRPGAEELDNGIDDDCDGVVDEGIADLDRDGFSVAEGDCNDADSWVFPGAIEMCDRVDNNCDGAVDEGCDGVVDEDTAAPMVPARCSCQTGPTPWAWLPLLLALPLVRRRRS